jgi:predicted acyltransferase
MLHSAYVYAGICSFVPMAALTTRLVSLDVFRGITVAAMLLVNNPGDWGHLYWPLEHAHWNGCTPTDLIFSFFLFIVGVSIAYALSVAKAAPDRRTKALGGVMRRTLVLAGLGLLASTWLDWDWATLRLPGVLMRIALVFGACSTIYLYTSWRTQVGLLLVLLVGYAALMQLVPVPGFGPANLEPTTNLGAWLDRTVLGEAHLWKESRTWDPEGLLGTLPAIGTGLLGVLAGQWLRRKDSTEKRRVSWLAAAGVLLVALGLLWNIWFPINKSLWTSSYVLFTGGLAMLMLAGLYWACDVKGWRRGTTVWRAFGVNALAAFFGSSLLARTLGRIQVGNGDNVIGWLYGHGIAPFFQNPYLASLAGGLVGVAIWAVVMMLLYRRGLIWKA